MILDEEPITKRYTYKELLNLIESGYLIVSSMSYLPSDKVRLFVEEKLAEIKIFIWLDPFNKNYYLLSGGEFLSFSCEDIETEIPVKIYYPNKDYSRKEVAKRMVDLYPFLNFTKEFKSILKEE